MPKPKDAKQQACAPSSLILACYFAPIRQALCVNGVELKEHRDSSDRLTIDFDKIGSGMYSKITKAVVAQFNLEVASKKTCGLDEVFQDYKSGESIVGLEWDNWSGYIVNAKTKSAEPLVREIGAYICGKFNT